MIIVLFFCFSLFVLVYFIGFWCFRFLGKLLDLLCFGL